MASQTQTKALQHVSKTLGSFDTYPIYKELINAMTECGIENSVRSKIMKKYESAVFEQKEKVSEAKSWVDAMINDTNK